MLCRIQRIPLALLLSILLSSCGNVSQPTEEPPVHASSTPSPTQTAVPPTSTPTPVRATFRLDRSALAYGIFETEATSLTIDVSNTVPGQAEKFADISVEDGSGLTAYKVPPGKSTITHAMSPGTKRVTITAGLQTKFRNVITGVFIDEITFNGSTVQVEQAGKRILVYGDSLAVGGNVEAPSAEAWPALLRRQFAIQVEAYGYRALYDDAATDETRAGFVSKLSSWRPDCIWLAIGANDYTFGPWSAQQFGEAYAATLDAIHSASSLAILFAQSPILQASESPNMLGDTLRKYRRQIKTACLVRSPWCIFVDGTNSAFPQPDELNEDGIHLTTQSSAKYAEAVLNVIRNK